MDNIPSQSALDDAMATVSQCEPSPDEQSVRRVFQYAGLALYSANCLEMKLVNFCLVLARIVHSEISRENLELIEEEASSKMLGKLLRDYKKVTSLDDCSVRAIDAALESRNRLAHHFFKDHAINFLSSEGREVMYDELVTMINRVEVADVIVETSVKAMGGLIGITDEMVASEFEKLTEGTVEQPV